VAGLAVGDVSECRLNHYSAFICYPYVCVSGQVRDLAYLWENVCESCPFLVFSVLW